MDGTPSCRAIGYTTVSSRGTKARPEKKGSPETREVPSLPHKPALHTPSRRQNISITRRPRLAAKETKENKTITGSRFNSKKNNKKKQASNTHTHTHQQTPKHFTYKELKTRKKTNSSAKNPRRFDFADARRRCHQYHITQNTKHKLRILAKTVGCSQVCQVGGPTIYSSARRMNRPTLDSRQNLL